MIRPYIKRFFSRTIISGLARFGAIIAILLTTGGLSAQRIISDLEEPAELAWYNEHFLGLEDSVVHYREAMKQPQVPMERRTNLEAYNRHLSRYRQAMRSFIDHHREEDTAAKALLMSCFREIDINQDTLRSLAERLEGEGRSNPYAAYLHQELDGRANNAVGKTFIDFSMPDQQGQMVSSDAYRGKYMLVLFWASWCVPCRAEMPAYLSVYHQFRDESLEVVAVSVDTDKAAWMRAIGQDKTDWVHVYDDLAWNSPVVRNYAIHRIPQSILVGPDGVIVAKNVSAQGLTKILNTAKTTLR